MSHITYSQVALQDLARLTDFMQSVAPHIRTKMIDTIQSGINELANFPEIGRKTEKQTLIPNGETIPLRELAIPFGKGAYMVLYYYTNSDDTVSIVSMKHSREQTYSIDI